MREMKDSGFRWLRNIPLDWDVLKIKDGFTRKKTKALQNDPIVLSLARSGVKVRDISTNEGQLAASYYEYNPVTIDDMLLNPMDLQSGANCSISKVSGVISPAYINLRYKKGFNPTFYDYYFKYQYWSYAFFSYGKGVSFDNRWTLNEDTLMNLPLLVPSKQEQDKIAKYLDKQCKKIDDVMADVQNQIDILEEYKKSVIFETVTRGLNLNIELKESKNSILGFVSKKYKIIKLKYLLTQNDGGLWGEEPSFNKQNSIVLRSTEQTIDGKWLIQNPAERYLGNPIFIKFYHIKNNDLLITKSSGSDLHIGKTTLATKEIECKNYFYSNFLQRLHTKEKILPRFLWWILNNKYSRDQFVYMQNSTSGIGNINSENINNLVIALPSLQEQAEITEYLDKKCSEIDSIIEDKKEQLETLENYKKSLIYEYVTGKKEVATND